MRNINLFMVAGLAACAVEPVETGELDQEITGSTFASDWQSQRAIWTGNCTATRISHRYALTAAHCGTDVGQIVQFYGYGTVANPSTTATVTSVTVRPGVDLAGCDAGSMAACTDWQGDFADIAVLKLSGASIEGAFEGPQVTLAWKYPGEGVLGDKVGAGGHNGAPNPDRVLLQATDMTLSNIPDDGRFYTFADQTDGGDSGGPFYVDDQQVGVLYGLSANSNTYTSVPEHLNWILATIGYKWMGQPSQLNTSYTGTVIDTAGGYERECQYACEKTEDCEGYNYSAGFTCQLLDNITGVTTVTGTKGALRYGPRGTANSGWAVGYVRSDTMDVVVHTWADQLHELYRTSTGWDYNNIQGSAPAVAGKVSAYRRSDGYNAIVYRSTANKIIERALSPSGTWSTNDLTNVANAPDAAGNPIGFVRPDGVNAVYYRTATGRIIELKLGSSSWSYRDLTAISGGHYSWDDLHACAYNGKTRIVYRSNTTIYDLEEYGDDGQWGNGTVSSSSTQAAGRPFCFTHSDGTPVVIYRTTSGAVIEKWRSGGYAYSAQIGSGAQSDPTGYVRTDGVESVLFRNGADVYELALTSSWGTYNISASAGGALAATETPSPFQRSDGYQSLVYESLFSHVGELAFKRGGPWLDNNLSSVSGESP